MSLGDINSTQKGSGARYNDGKPALNLIPLRLIAHDLRRRIGTKPEVHAMEFLAAFQERDPRFTDRSALERIPGLFPVDIWKDCANVFTYGLKKYAEWNWAKGMPWSAVIGCAARHLMDMAEGTVNDHESGLPHRGHFMCNIVMLLTYLDNYPQGDDRMPASIFHPQEPAE